jgi:DNA-binding PadR family transcriptional regulator
VSPAPATEPALLLGDWAVLGLVAEGPTHGYALARALAADGELGGIWTLSRPLVYRAVGKLCDAGLVVAAGIETGDRGPRRERLVCAAEGRVALERWLAEPVSHLRDTRTVLLVKLALLERAGRDPTALLEAQRDAFAPLLLALRRRVRETDGFELTVARFRHESARGVERFIAAALADAGATGDRA